MFNSCYCDVLLYLHRTGHRITFMSIGANNKTLPIIQNTASNAPPKKSLTGFAFSPIAAKARPKNTEKKIIGNNSPEDNASNILVGTIFTIVSIKWLPYVLPR